ncbi:type II secretion system protein [Cerasicoccus frondis]|uniref:type II secretion system protein n=1 Tax=Cerasicoccus frondis TaxID=490090 RepID=UPI002852563D|nr:type II secretion system protein [Cerasicoccus frondis]
MRIDLESDSASACFSRSFISQKRRAFTLVELLAAIAVVAILGSILLVAVGQVRSSAKKSQGISDLRQVGAAVSMFAYNNDGVLPGPSNLGLYPFYRNEYPQERTMQASIAPYLDNASAYTISGRTFIPSLICPVASEDVDDPDNPPPYYIQNFLLPIPRGRVFGAQESASAEATTGWRLSRIDQLGQDVWLITNADQAIPSDWSGFGTAQLSASGWFSRLPEKPVYENGRLRLYLDGHVEFVSRDVDPVKQ